MEIKLKWILQSEVHTTCWKISGRYKSFKSLYFLVKWKGYPEAESTWEPGMSLEHALESIERFDQSNPKVLAITTRGRDWRRQGVSVMDMRIIKLVMQESVDTWHYDTYHMICINWVIFPNMNPTLVKSTLHKKGMTNCDCRSTTKYEYFKNNHLTQSDCEENDQLAISLVRTCFS
jgi:hypothetical protein